MAASLFGNVIGRKKVVSPSDDGKMLLLADTGSGLAGVWAIQFWPDPDSPFDGSISVQARIQGQQAYDDKAPVAPVPFRAAVLNGAIGDYALRSDLITGASLFYVPATGLAVALLVQCSSGRGTLYSYPREGDAGLP